MADDDEVDPNELYAVPEHEQLDHDPADPDDYGGAADLSTVDPDAGEVVLL